MSNKSKYEFEIGGTLPPNAQCYVHRKADVELYEKLIAAKYCYVFNSRQMGKSSLAVRTMHELRKNGMICVSVDLTEIGKQVSAEQWYAGVVRCLVKNCDDFSQLNWRDWWLEQRDLLSPVQRLNEFIVQKMLPLVNQNLVIFVDEIDSVLDLDFKIDDFFAAIRACYNKRFERSENKQIIFCLLGVAAPSDLIKDKERTSFNIGEPIELTGLSFEEALPILSRGLNEVVYKPEEVLKEVFNYTAGQPFLTQKLCKIIVEKAESRTPNIGELVQIYIIDNWESQDNPQHLRTIRDRLLRNDRGLSAWERQKKEQRTFQLLAIYQQILEKGEIVADDSAEQMDLQLSGLVVEKLGKLKLYNRIYREVFDEKWVNLALKNLCPFSQNVAAWEDSYFKDESRLLRGKALKDAQDWKENKTLSELDRKFLDASDRRERERKRTRLLFAGIMIAIGATGGMFLQRWRIQQQRPIEIATQLAKQAEEIIENNPDNLTRSMLLAVEADRRAPSVEKAEEILKQGLNLLPRPIAPPLNHQEGINKIAFSPNSQYLATASNDNTARVWDAKTGKPLANPLKHDDAVADVAFNANYIATASWDNTARVWNTLAGEQLRPLEHEDAVLAVAFAFRPDVNITFIATASNDDTAQLWNLYTGEGYAPLKHNGAVVAIAFSRDGRYLATASNDKTAGVWDTNNDRELAKFRHPGPVVAIVFSPDGKYIATVSNDNMARVWEWRAPTNEPAMEFLHDGPVNAIAFSPDSKYLATASSDNTARVWDLTNQQQVVSLDHQGRVDAVAFNPDGKFLATASGTNTARVWEVDGGQEVARINHQDRVTAIAFSPDGQYLATASEDGTARLWEPRSKDINDDEEAREEVCQRLTRNLTTEEWEEYLPGLDYRQTCPNLPSPS